MESGAELARSATQHIVGHDFGASKLNVSHPPSYPRSMSMLHCQRLARSIVFACGGCLAQGLALAPIAAQRGVPRTNVASAGTEIFLAPLSGTGATLKVGAPVNLTGRDGYDNQPAFAPDGRALFFTSTRDGATDIYRYDLASSTTTSPRKTAVESEYSAAVARDGRSMAVIRVEADSTQRLWRLALPAAEGTSPANPASSDTPIFAAIKPVGYFAQADDSTWALFVLGTPATLQVARTTSPRVDTVARDIGRSLHRIPGSSRVSYVQKGPDGWHVMTLDPATGIRDTVVRTPTGSEDLAWVDGTTLVMGQGSKLYSWTRGASELREIADLATSGIGRITRIAVSADGRRIAFVGEVTLAK